MRGFYDTPPQIILKTLEPFKKDTISQVSIIGFKGNNYLNEIDSAFLNGVSAHTLDLDDGHKLGQIHPGAIVFSTAIAISQKHDLTSKEFLESVIIGYDIGIILSTLVNPNHRNQGFHTSGTIGTFISGAVTAKLLKFDKKEIINTLGLCGTQSSGLLESNHTGSMAKPLHIGRSVSNGILSAYLAKNGLTGSEYIFEGKEGFVNGMSAKTQINTEFFNKFKKNINKHHIREVYHKLYPFCRHIHSSIDSALNIKKYIIENNIRLNEIKNININTYSITCQHNNFKPKNPQELRQSLPMAVALTIIYSSPNLNLINKLINNNLFQYSNTELNLLLNKINIKYDENIEKEFPLKRISNIELNTYNNKSFNSITEYSKGECENPLNTNDIIKKFKEINPKYDIEKLNIIKNMEDYKINNVINKINKV